MSRTKLMLAIAGAAVLVVGGLAVATAGRLTADQPQREIEIQRETFVRQIAAGGELRSAENVTIGPPGIPRFWNFTITFIADEGTEVKAGEPLLTFDAQKLMERLQVKQSELDTARKELEKTVLEQQETFERLVLEEAEIKAKKARIEQKLDVPAELQKRLELEKLRLDFELSEEELRLAALRIETQRKNMTGRIGSSTNRVESLEREVAQLEQNVEKMTVRAPREGFVVHVPDWNGTKVKVGESVWYGRQIIELADLEHMEVAAEVAEPDAGFVAVGQKAEVRLDANPGRLFTGRIVSLGRLFRPKSHEIPSMIFDAVIVIDEPDASLMRPGMATKVKILAPSAGPVIQIPEAAVRNTDRGPEVAVRRGSGALKTIPVSLGDRWQGRVIVTSGLEEGDSVVVSHDS